MFYKTLKVFFQSQSLRFYFFAVFFFFGRGEIRFILFIYCGEVTRFIYVFINGGTGELNPGSHAS